MYILKQNHSVMDKQHNVNVIYVLVVQMNIH